jgi:hypothetical protein
MGSDLASARGIDGGMQVATVRASTSFRIKKRGKVPPRLATLRTELVMIEERKGWIEGTYVASRVI